MHIIRYSAARLAFGLLAGLAMLLSSFAMLGADRSKVHFAGVLFLIIGPILAISCLKTLLGDRNALKFDATSVEITTLWRHHRFAWSQVEAVLLKTVNSYAAYGLIKTGSSQSLNIKTTGGLFGSRNYSISKVFLDINDQDYAALPAQIEQARRGAQPSQSTISQTPSGFRAPLQAAERTPVYHEPPHGPRPSNDDKFDPDAALARYMQRKAESTPSPAPMLNGEPLQAGASPSRPAFGRKGVHA